MNDIKVLQEQLSTAIKLENYTEASRLRDLLNSIEPGSSLDVNVTAEEESMEVDDLKIGNWYAIVGLKEDQDYSLQLNGFPFVGIAFKVMNTRLPFVVGKWGVNIQAPCTWDTRAFSFIKVDETYVKAQQGKDPTEKPKRKNSLSDSVPEEKS